MGRHVLIVLMSLLLLVASGVSAQSSGACAGFDSRLAVGMQARVLPGTPNNVRSAPSRDAERVGTIPGDGIFDVLEGPTCNGELTWWRVAYGGVNGWTAEGTGAERYIEPAGALGIGGAAGGAPVNGSTSGQRFVPQDVIQGIAFGGFGGGGGEFEGTPPPTNLCMTTLNDDLLTYSPTITSGAAAYALDEYDANFYPLTEAMVENPPSALANGALVSDVSMFFPEGSTSIDFGFAPSLCVASTDQSPAAVSPDGETMQPSYTALDGITQVLLPVEAYITPGVWTLRLGDLSLDIEIAPPPQVSTLTEWIDSGLFVSRRVFWGGMTPNTNAVVITFSGDVREIQANADGYAATEYDSEYTYITAFVSEDGRNIQIAGNGHIGVPSAEMPDFYIPESASRDLLYNVIWQNQPYPGDAWRCPGAMARQMTLPTYEYRLTTDRLNVRADVGVNAPVVTTISSGQIVSVINGVECADDAHWWQIIVNDLRAPDGTLITGWVAEGMGGEYFFAPVE